MEVQISSPKHIMSFPSQTILRFRASPEANPYVAIVLVEGGNLLEVKRGGVSKRVIYSSLEEWLESMDEHPTVDQLEARSKDDSGDEKEVASASDSKSESEPKAVKPAKAEKSEKGEKPKKEKKVKLNLIPRSQRNHAMGWTHHIHKIIKEAKPALLNDPRVILAFNHLVDVLLQHNAHIITTFGDSRYTKYTSGIDITDIESLKKGCRVRLNSVFFDKDHNRYVIRSEYYGRHDVKTPEQQAMEQTIYEDVLKAYLSLFDLIKQDVIPFMEQRAKAMKEKQNSDRILALSERMENLQTAYEKEIARRQALIARFTQSHERQMAGLRSSMMVLMQQGDK
jgi:hypothetical protein